MSFFNGLLVLFPQMVRPIFVGRAKTMQAAESAMATDCRVLVVTQRRAAEDDPPSKLFIKWVSQLA